LTPFAFLACRLLLAQPVADHHQHLLQSAAQPPQGFALTAKDLVAQLDQAGIQRAVVLSIAYQFGNPNRPPVENEYDRVKAENDWTSQQAALYPKRLIAFCSVNPLKDYAIAEIRRCSKDRLLRAGLKLHFGNSDVDLDNPAHVAQIRRVFKEADRHRMAIVAHIRSTVSRKRPWGAQQAVVFLNQVLPAARRVPVQIAHLADAGGYGTEADAALGVFAAAAAANDARMKRVFIDVSGVFAGRWDRHAQRIVERLRALGLGRVLYGSDGPTMEAVSGFRKLPLAAEEVRRIETNLAPYLK